MEFVQKAVEAGHPQSLRSCIPEILRKAVKVNAETTSLQRAKHRTEMMKSWRLMARDLESEEQHLKASMPPHLNRILQSKRIKLWERLLREANYQDMGVVNEVVCGTPLVGETETTGLWPSKFVPAMVTEEQLQEISAREKWETIRKVATCESPETDSQVWDKTLSELQQGWIVGPLKHSEVPDGCPLSRRFGVIQGEKTRCVDDFTKSSVNLAVQVTESPKPHTVDVLGALLGEVISAGPGDEPWLIRPFDLKDAYRQCGVATSSLKYSHIVVRDPSRERAEIFQMLALPFGSVRSVHAFLRVSHSIWFILVHYLSILATNYFDDFVVVARESEAKHVTSVVHGVFKLLGWSFAESGAKAPDFKGKANALGVAVDVSSLHTGVVRIDNTESRKDDLSKLVQSILSTGTLTSIEALKLRGRMQFTAGQLFGRVARMCLNQVTQHAYHATGTQISLETSTALSRYSRFLLQGKPRSITKGLSDTWFVYTDASYEIVEGQNTAGFGGTLVDPSGNPVRYFSFELVGKDLLPLNPSSKKTIIYECELFALSVAFDVWMNTLQGKQVVFFIDNNAVRDSLIGCKSSSKVASVILEQVLQAESDASIIPWFARVPSKSNIADDPSRGQVEQLTKLNCVQEHVSLKRKLELIDHKTSGGAEGSIVPNQSSKKVRKLSPSGLNET